MTGWWGVGNVPKKAAWKRGRGVGDHFPEMLLEV